MVQEKLNHELVHPSWGVAIRFVPCTVFSSSVCNVLDTNLGDLAIMVGYSI
jgi:hypothetical protein